MLRPASTTPTALLLIDIQEGFNYPTHWGTLRSTPTFESNIPYLLSSARHFNSALPSSSSSASPFPSHPILIIHVHHHSLDPSSALHPSHHNPPSSSSSSSSFSSSTIPSITPQTIATPASDGSEPVIIKHRNSSFVGTDLEARLRTAGIKQLIVVGLSTDHCVSTTVRMAANLQVLGDENGADGNGFGVNGVVVVEDATATWERGEWDAETVHKVQLECLRDEFAMVAKTEEVIRRVFGRE